MNRTLDRLSWLITARPWITILVLVLITVLLAAGAARRAEVVEGAALAFLPPGHPVGEAVNEINELFGDSGDVRVVTLVFRGETLTPEGLSQMDGLLDAILADDEVVRLLAPGDALLAPSAFIGRALQVDGFESVTQAEIDAVRSAPELQAAIEAMTGIDEDGTPVAIATIRLSDSDEGAVEEAEREINELANENEGPLRVSSVSPTVVEDEYKEATESGMIPLIGLALYRGSRAR